MTEHERKILDKFEETINNTCGICGNPKESAEEECDTCYMEGQQQQMEDRRHPDVLNGRLA